MDINTSNAAAAAATTRARGAAAATTRARAAAAAAAAAAAVAVTKFRPPGRPPFVFVFFFLLACAAARIAARFSFGISESGKRLQIRTRSCTSSKDHLPRTPTSTARCDRSDTTAEKHRVGCRQPSNLLSQSSQL